VWIFNFFLSAGAFGGVAFLSEQFYQNIAMVALDLYDTVFDGAAGTAFLLKFLGKGFKSVVGEGQAGDDGYTFAFTAFSFTADTDVSVAFGRVFLYGTDTIACGFTAFGAHFAGCCGIDDTGITVIVFFHIG
jgi:hypothetical protein